MSAFRETEPDWDLEIAADTKEECAKFGQVAHLHVDRNSKASSVMRGLAGSRQAVLPIWFTSRGGRERAWARQLCT